MPDIIEIKENTRQYVMVKLSPGKQSLTAVAPEIQQAQKGPTCWWYGDNMVRLRLGKDFDKEYNALVKKLNELYKTAPVTAEQYYKEVLKPLKIFRNDEKIVSTYRKMLTHCDQLEKLRIRFCRSADSEPSIYKDIDPSKLTSETEKQFYAYLVEFRNQNVIQSFKEFLSKKIIAIKRAATITVFEKMGDDSITQEIEYVEAKRPANEIAHYYQVLVRRVAALQLGLKKSTWKTSEGIDHLIASIKKEGAIVVCNKEGPPYYKANAAKKVKDNSDIPYTVYSLSPSDRLDEKTIHTMNNHAAVIVLAEKGTHENKGLDFVYFMDPNDRTIPGKPPKVYKVPFEQFKASAQENFNYHANNEKINNLVASYKAMIIAIKYQRTPTPPPQNTVLLEDQLKSALVKTNISALKELAIGISFWAVAGLIATALLAKVIAFSFIALPAFLIAGTVMTIRDISNQSLKKPSASTVKHPAIEKSSTASIAERAQFDKLPTHSSVTIAPIQSSESESEPAPIAPQPKPDKRFTLRF